MKIRIVFILLIVLIIWSFFIEPRLLTQNNLKTQSWSGPPIKIAFFSDLHAGSPHIDLKYIKKLVDEVNNNQPDLILIGGDLASSNIIGGQKIAFSEVARQLKALKAPLGVYAVLGNHDWWNGDIEIRNELLKNSIIVLENEAKLIVTKESQSFWLIGIGDHYTGHSDTNKAFGLSNNDYPKILFMHDPASLLDTKNKFSIAFAGHLHGGQVYIPKIGALITPGEAPKSWAKGWVDFEFGRLYVSQGVGTSILPVRLNSLPEFVILDLIK